MAKLTHNERRPRCKLRERESTVFRWGTGIDIARLLALIAVLLTANLCDNLVLHHFLLRFFLVDFEILMSAGSFLRFPLDNITINSSGSMGSRTLAYLWF